MGDRGSIASSQGLGLIELLVATALGFTLATGVLHIYTVNTLAARDLEARIRVQENGRLALHFLLQELRAAPSTDCTPEQWHTLVEASDAPFLQHIRGWEAAGTAPGQNQGSALHDANLEVVASDEGGWLSSAGVLEGLSLLPGSDVIGFVSPCAAVPTSGNDVRHGTYFYVGKRGDAAGNPSSLFRRNSLASSGRAEELFEGVVNLQVLYGVAPDAGSGVTDYVVASEVEDWQSVMALRITLLLQSVEDGLMATSQPYDFHGVRYDGAVGNGPAPADRRLRRVLSTTLSLPGSRAMCVACLAGGGQ